MSCQSFSLQMVVIMASCQLLITAQCWAVPHYQALCLFLGFHILLVHVTNDSMWLLSWPLWSATFWSCNLSLCYFLSLSQCSHLSLMATSSPCWTVKWSSMDYLPCVLQSILPTLLPVLLKSYFKCIAVRWV